MITQIERGECLLKKVTDNYLKSHDFNGLAANKVKDKIHLDNTALSEKDLVSLIKEEKISLVFSDNPHIKRLPISKIEEQIQQLITTHSGSFCIYPSEQHLENVVNSVDYRNLPYSYELALGRAQLDFRSFDISILEYYRNDPRYYYENNAIGGRISIVDEHYSSNNMSDQDKVHLQTFGFCYDDNGSRAVAVFLRYLKQLNSNHQQVWHAKELGGDWNLHSDYHRFSLGNWNIGISIFDAFVEEFKAINKMCKTMNKPALFKNTFEQEVPKEFSFLIRPTTKEFYQFILVFDKMISENLNKEFFKTDILNGHIESKNEDGVSKGSISLVESWLNKFYQIEANEALSYQKLLLPFKAIRKERTIPAHKMVTDKWDPDLISKQEDLLIQSYESLSILRIIFSRHPDCINNDFGMSAAVLEGRIWCQ
jgi:hypothetical protein